MKELKPIKVAFALLLLSVVAGAQQNFTYSPATPTAGETVKLLYKKEGGLKTLGGSPEAVVYQISANNKVKISEYKLNKAEGDDYTIDVPTDTSARVLFIGFLINKTFDATPEDGYQITFYENGKPRAGANAGMALFYQYFLEDVGGKNDKAKAMLAFEKEYAAYPDAKKTSYPAYLRLLTSENKEKANEALQKEVEATLKAGLKTEEDYQYVEQLYGAGRLTSQAQFITGVKKEKFPQGKWLNGDQVSKFSNEKNAEKKEAALKEIFAKIATDANWKNYEASKGQLAQQVANAYSTDGKWDEFERVLDTYVPADKADAKAMAYYSAANKLVKDSTKGALAEKYAEKAFAYATNLYKNNAGTKPEDMTRKDFESRNKSYYAYFGDLYAQALNKNGKQKIAFPIIKEIALNISEGKVDSQNGTYAKAAEKVVKPAVLKKDLEQFVKSGAATGDIKDLLKSLYVKEKKSEAGYDEYLAALQQESMNKLLAELKESMISQTAPTFAVNNIKGEKVDLAALKGKVVVLDFWATWCGPCIASFPGMQKAVNKYAEDKDVAFLFVNSWESSADKKKGAADFIEKNNYTFNVPLDLDDKVIGSYAVTGIPTKFVLDKQGNIVFKKVGGGSSEKLVDELVAMIELAKTAGAKAF